MNRRLVGDGLFIWGEEAREGGVLTAVEEALRCSMRNFRPIPPPTGQHHSTQLTPAAQRPLLVADYNHSPSLLPPLQSGMFQPKLSGQWT